MGLGCLLNKMPIELAYPHIEKRPGEPARLGRIPRVRISQIVMDYLAHGWSAEEMCRQHPYLTLAEAHAAMGYYYDHQDQIDAEVRAELETVSEKLPAERSRFYARIRVMGLR